ncbi:MAG: dockerin type I repeat-containing protein [Candidatus Zixiibacteriota bacterium]
MRYCIYALLLASIVLVNGAVAADDSIDPATGEDINWQVISSGGTNGSSDNFRLAGTVGQTAHGAGSSVSFRLNHGYWQDFSGTICVPGDADGSGEVDIDDVVYLIAYIFSGGLPPTPDVCCGDADGSGEVDIDDVVYLIAYIFTGGPAPIDAC